MNKYVNFNIANIAYKNGLRHFKSEYDNFHPCHHSGCIGHKYHPCEECQRIAGLFYPTWIELIYWIFSNKNNLEHCNRPLIENDRNILEMSTYVLRKLMDFNYNRLKIDWLEYWYVLLTKENEDDKIDIIDGFIGKLIRYFIDYYFISMNINISTENKWLVTLTHLVYTEHDVHSITCVGDTRSGAIHSGFIELFKILKNKNL